MSHIKCRQHQIRLDHRHMYTGAVWQLVPSWLGISDRKGLLRIYHNLLVMSNGLYYGRYTYGEILELIFNNNTNNMLNLSAMTLVLYDYLLTFPQEVACIWNRKISAVTILFLTNRYATLFDLTLSTGYDIGSTYIRNPKHAYSYTPTRSFSCLRVWAIWERNILPAIPVFLLSMFVPAVRIYNYSVAEKWLIFTDGPLPGCWGVLIHGIPKHSRDTSANALVFILTWVKTASLFKESRRLRLKASLPKLLIINGALQFAIFTIFDLRTTHPDARLRIQSVVISRFMLDLRSIHAGGEAQASLRTITAIQFAGNLGAPLRQNLSWEVGAGDDDQLEEEAMVFSNDPLTEGLDDSVHREQPVEEDPSSETDRFLVQGANASSIDAETYPLEQLGTSGTPDVEEAQRKTEEELTESALLCRLIETNVDAR
ncbi:hypothetical protein K474DRAFT_1674125 [Panus rudis PR-1116 ss-1]|nr:hypothetical protein K474DRAFT_1674125 [Panus rudis PR-1116 ss-1]